MHGNNISPLPLELKTATLPSLELRVMIFPLKSTATAADLSFILPSAKNDATETFRSSAIRTFLLSTLHGGYLNKGDDVSTVMTLTAELVSVAESNTTLKSISSGAASAGIRELSTDFDSAEMVSTASACKSVTETVEESGGLTFIYLRFGVHRYRKQQNTAIDMKLLILRFITRGFFQLFQLFANHSFL